MPTAPVVGQVLDVQAIPDADQVRLARVDIGCRVLRIVFGGHPVVELGALVPVAPPGSRVARRCGAVDVKIRVRRYRDTRSEGMLCSLVELGWVDDGPDEVAVLRRGRAGDVLPLEGDLAHWLAEDAYRRHVEHFVRFPIDEVRGPQRQEVPGAAPVAGVVSLPRTSPLPRADLAAACGILREARPEPVRPPGGRRRLAEQLSVFWTSLNRSRSPRSPSSLT